MRQDIIQRRERTREQRSGLFGSIGFHLLLLLLALLPIWNLYKSDVGGGGEAEGIMAFGETNAGGSTMEIELEQPAAEQAAITPPPPPPPPAPEDPSKVIQTDDENELSVEKPKKEDKKPVKPAEVKPAVTKPAVIPPKPTDVKPTIDPKKVAADAAKVAAAATAKAAADAKASADAAKAQALRDKLKGVGKGGGGSGTGSGTGSGGGKQGSPTGDPNGTGTGGTGKGPGGGGSGGGTGGGSGGGTGGMVGGGISRNLKSKPICELASQERGNVTIDICIDQAGKVVSATKGKTINITDAAIIAKCIACAKQYTFTPNDAAGERECGNVMWKFSVN